jgi:hypothetical protein
MEEKLEQPQQPEPEIDVELIPEEKPATLTVVIQSWATPIAGIVMLVIGLFTGYFGRPLLVPDQTPIPVEESASTDAGDLPAVVPTTDADRAAQQQEMMSAVVERTRHFLGDPDAPVTIIEFSDFQ